MTSAYLDTPRRALWKAQADMDRADYFRWTFRHPCGTEFVVSLGKAYRNRSAMCHAASADTSEVLLFAKTATRVDLLPSSVFPLLKPFDRYFDTQAGPIALHMPDSIVDSLLFALAWHLAPAKEYKATTLYHGTRS